ncbi:hypothetical protein [Deinococcus sedimenti]|uniref:Uncharacterized protein n=1 Tax=Deinococcus sedimenti TaxID=1867090 RepID=A0ABQ2S3X3_9DEIO|nr:hypothetical protein [Deinococcus sedimenti]GGR83409.1 hypothetical protein GCM10008960_08060 [Deinococcus sedimenti]
MRRIAFAALLLFSPLTAAHASTTAPQNADPGIRLTCMLRTCSAT